MKIVEGTHMQLVHRDEALDAEFEHVEQVAVEEASEQQVRRPLLRVRAKREQRRVRLCAELLLQRVRT